MQYKAQRKIDARAGLGLGLFLTLLFFCLWTAVLPVKAAETTNKQYHKILDGMKEDLSYAEKHYELGRPDFTVHNREPEVPLSSIASPRYTKGKDGIYRSSTTQKDGVATIMLTGDLMCQKGQQDAALNTYGCYDFNDNFTYVKSVLSSADFAVGNLETMLSESASFYSEEEKVEGRPQCNAPATFLDGVRYAGFDMVVTSNNHNCDVGVKGIFQTLAHLKQYKLIYTGLFQNKEEDRFKIVEIDGIKVAFMAYAKYFNTKDQYLTDTGKNVLLNKYSKARVKKDVKAAKTAGAEYIIAYIHWGTEFVNEQSASQAKDAKELADVGVDYIMGSHPHALMPYDHVKASDGRNVPVIYSMGNFVSHMVSRDMTTESMILKIELKKNKKGKVVLKSEGYIPCRIIKKYDGHNYTCLPLTSPYNNGNLTKYGKETYPHIRSIITDRLQVLGKFPLKKVDITQSYTQTIYSGKAKNPRVTLTDGLGNPLKKDVDYTITRTANVLPGVSTIKVKGIGFYNGSWTGTLYIRPAKVEQYKMIKSDERYIFTWDKSVGADGYYIYLKGPGEDSYSRYDKISGEKYIMKRPATAGTYYVKVKAYKKTNEKTLLSPYSSELHFTIKS